MEQLQATKEGVADAATELLGCSPAISAPSLPINSSVIPSVEQYEANDGGEDDEEPPDFWEQKHAWDHTTHLPRTDFARRQFFSRVLSFTKELICFL